MSELENNTPVTEASEVPTEAPVEPASATMGDEKPKKPKKSFWRELGEWVVTIAAALAIAFVVRSFLFEPVRVDGKSMWPTLDDGEIMFVTKTGYTTLHLGNNYWNLFGDPDRFDVVICHYPNRGNTNFVKRVVGLPGDKIEISGGYLYVNGEKYEEEYLTNRPNYSLREYTVPEGYYFVLGDNRSNSNDSHSVGPIPREYIVGHVQQVVFPFGQWRRVE